MKNIFFFKKKNWYYYTNSTTEIFIKGFNVKNNYKELSRKIFQFKNLQSLISLISSIKENFALIIKKKNKIYLATDRIRSFPLLYTYKNKKFYIFENVKQLNKLNIQKSIDSEQVLFFSLSGYSFNDGTIYKNLKQVNKSTLIYISNGTVKKINYESKKQNTINKFQKLKKALKSVNEKIIINLIQSCKDKYIVIPLSAGYDSRFILSGLIHKGFKNIIAFSYGRKGNRESKIAKNLADKLKIQWYHIPYTNHKLRTIINSREYKKFLSFSDSFTSIPFPSEFYAVNHLKKNHLIPKNSVIVNGQSGDFITGNHLPEINYSSTKIFSNLLEAYISKHYNLWPEYSLINKKQLLQLISSKLEKNMSFYKIENYYKIYEDLEFENRQCKYVINGIRLYEFFNYEWRLPLWDPNYIDFWKQVPLKYKLNQKLYKRVLIETNWCGVWDRIPINPSNTFALYISLIRFFLKGFFIFSGKNSWHLFEKKYLNYFIDPLCGYSEWSYTNVIMKKKEFRHSLSLATDTYLRKKHVDWETVINKIEN